AAGNLDGESPQRPFSHADYSQPLRETAGEQAILPSSQTRACECCSSNSIRPTVECRQALRLREADRNSTIRHPFSIACESAGGHSRFSSDCRDTLDTRGFQFLRREKIRSEQSECAPADFPAAGSSSFAAE